MPFDGKEYYQPKMSLEEQALRNADAFFTGPEKWHQGGAEGSNGSKCLGAAIIQFSPPGLNIRPLAPVATLLGLECEVSYWNDKICPNYAAMKEVLGDAIARYERERIGELVT